MRHRLLAASLAVAAIVLAAAAIAAALPSGLPGDAPPAPPAPLTGPLSDPPSAPGASPGGGLARVDVDAGGYWSWALLDRTTGELTGGPDRNGTSSTESMIKVWIVADRLRSYTAAGLRPPEEELALGSAAIRHSDDAAAESLYRVGGSDDVVRRLIDICGLTGTTIYPAYWARTEMSAADAVRMGLCVADGRAAGPDWTEWVLAEMREVRGTTAEADQPHGGRWGIIDALPPAEAGRLAIKNGWTPILADGLWHISCLAIADEWILAVHTRYPVALGLDHGAGICRDVAAQALSIRDEPAR